MPLNDVKAIAECVYNTCAVVAGGKVYCWGKNDSGQLTDAADSLLPVTVEGL